MISFSYYKIVKASHPQNMKHHSRLLCHLAGEHPLLGDANNTFSDVVAAAMASVELEEIDSEQTLEPRGASSKVFSS